MTPVPSPRKSGKSAAIFVLVVAGIVLAVNARNPLPHAQSDFQAASSAITAYCRDKASEARGGYQSWIDAGVIKDRRATVVVVDELPWELATHKQKLSVTMFAYCMFGGKYVSVEGYHDGQQKAYMVEGNYFD